MALPKVRGIFSHVREYPPCTPKRTQGARPLVLSLGGLRGILSFEKESIPLFMHSCAAWKFLAALRAALFFIRFGIARQRIEIQIQRHQLAEAREDFVFELRRE